MSQDATVKIRLDTSGARSELQGLYGDMRRAPAVQVPGAVPGGGVPGGGAGAGGGVGAGGFNLSSLLGSLARLAPLAMLGAPAIGDAFATANGVLGGIGAAANPFQGVAAGVRGRQRAIDETAQTFGLARGLGLVGEKESQAFYETIRPFREAQATGEAAIKGELGWEQAKSTLDDVGTRIVSAIEGLGKSLGVGR